MRHYLDEQADAAEEREARERAVETPETAKWARQVLSARRHKRELQEAKTIHDARKALYFRYREGRASGDPVSASGLAQVAAELWPC